MLSAFGPPPDSEAATARSAVLSSALLQSRLLTQPGQKKYKGRHSFVDFLPSTTMNGRPHLCSTTAPGIFSRIASVTGYRPHSTQPAVGQV